MTDPRYLRSGVSFALGHAIEEAGEFLAAAGKSTRWGLDSFNPELAPADRETNEAWLRREMADLMGALGRLQRELDQRAEADRCDYEISDDGVMSATAEWTRDNDATALRLLACHSVDVSDQIITAWTDEQVKQVDIWAWSCALSASDNDDIQVPQRPDFLPDALSPLMRHPITGEPL